MTVRNTLKALLKSKGKKRYWLWKETGLSQNTAYRLVDDPSYIPGGEVMDAVCKALRVQPGEWLVWTPDEDEDDAEGDRSQ
ncbi:MAG: helix-turn-helix transcriptional regulator [Pseudanabaenales cyanobacterium]|nr:helix-turn-helix transcriptional regulator [Pseudanabaenales cyanobacterium]